MEVKLTSGSVMDSADEQSQTGFLLSPCHCPEQTSKPVVPSRAELQVFSPWAGYLLKGRGESSHSEGKSPRNLWPHILSESEIIPSISQQKEGLLRMRVEGAVAEKEQEYFHNFLPSERRFSPFYGLCRVEGKDKYHPYNPIRWVSQVMIQSLYFILRTIYNLERSSWLL